MANNPNPQEFNRDVDLNKPEDFTDALSAPKAKEFASEEFALLRPEKDVNNAAAYTSGPAPAQRKTYTSPEIVDKSKAMNIAKWGSAAVQTAELADKAYRQHVEDEIQKLRDQSNSFWSLDTEDAVLPTGGGEPPGLAADATKMYTATDAYKAGKMSETHYLAYIEKEARRLRNKYGKLGYDNFVDDTIAKVMGFDPANRLREHMLRQAEAAASQKDPSYEKAERAILYNDAPYWAIQDPTGALSDPAKVAAINLHVAKKAEREQRKEMLLDSNVITEEMSKQAVNVAMSEVNDALDDINYALPFEEKFDKLGNLAASYREGGAVPSGEDLAKFEALQEQVRYEMSEHFKAKAAALGRFYSPEQQKRINEYIDMRVAGISYNITDSKSRELTDNIIKSQENNIEMGLASDPNVRLARFLATPEGSQLSKQTIAVLEAAGRGEHWEAGNKGTGISATEMKVAEHILKVLGVPRTEGQEVNRVREGLSSTERGLFDFRNADVLADPNVSLDAKATLVENLFHNQSTWAEEYPVDGYPEEKARGYSNPAQALYNQYSRIEVADAIKQLPRDRQAQYVNWLSTRLGENMLKKIPEVQNHIVSRPGLEFQFNPDTLQLEVKDVGRPSEKLVDILEDKIFEDPNNSIFFKEHYAREAVKQFNEDILRFKMVSEHLGLPPHKTLLVALGNMGLDPNAPKEPTIGLNLRDVLEQAYVHLMVSTDPQTDPARKRQWLNQSDQKKAE